MKNLNMHEREILAYRIINQIGTDTLEQDVVATEDYALLALLMSRSGFCCELSPCSVKTIIDSGNKRLISLVFHAFGSLSTDEVINCLADRGSVPSTLLAELYVDDGGLKLLEFLAKYHLVEPKRLVKTFCYGYRYKFTEDEINLLATKKERIPDELFDKIVRENEGNLMRCLSWLQRLPKEQVLKIFHGDNGRNNYFGWCGDLVKMDLIKYYQLPLELIEEIFRTGTREMIVLLRKKQKVLCDV